MGWVTRRRGAVPCHPGASSRVSAAQARLGWGSRGAMPACLGGWGANPLRNALSKGRGDARTAWAQAALGFRAAAALEQRQGQMVAGPAPAACRSFGRAWQPCPGRGRCRPLAPLPTHPRLPEVVPPRVLSSELAPGGCQVPSLWVPIWGDGAGEPPAAAPASSQLHIRLMAALWGAATGTRDVQDRARGWAGFLRQKIPGKLCGCAGGLGLAVSHSEGLAWGEGAAPAPVCRAHTLPLSEDCGELGKHG